MKALFQVPKDADKAKKKARKKRAKNAQSRTSESDPSRDSRARLKVSVTSRASQEARALPECA
jgi:hypothetical protein